MELGGTWRFGEDFEVIIWRARHKGLGSFFIEEVDRSRHHVKNLAIKGGLDWMKWLKNGAEKDFIFHAIFLALCISFLVKMLLAKLKNLCIYYA